MFHTASTIIGQQCATKARIDLLKKAAKGRDSWGLDAYNRFCNNNGVDKRLVRLVRQLEAANKVGF